MVPMNLGADASAGQIQAGTGEVACVEVPRGDLTRPLSPLSQGRVVDLTAIFATDRGRRCGLTALDFANADLVCVASHKTVITQNVQADALVGFETGFVAGNLRLPA